MSTEYATPNGAVMVNPMRLPNTLHLILGGICFVLAGALLLSLLAGILPIRRVRRDSIVDAIREEG